MSKNDDRSKLINPDRGMQSRLNKMERFGGIYLELNTSPDGWVFSENMHKDRQIVRIDCLEELYEKTGVDIALNYLQGKVELKVPHPSQITELWVAGNNSFGSLRNIKDPTKGLEVLVAENGQHITFEPVYSPRVRIHVYPIGYDPDSKK